MLYAFADRLFRKLCWQLDASLQARVYEDSWVTDSWLADLCVALLIDILEIFGRPSFNWVYKGIL